jgi:predicted molibdopterin-dependent oxidoreductase YjgC
VFATFHTPEVFLNLVTSSERDGITGTPEYKRTSVRIEKIS